MNGPSMTAPALLDLLKGGTLTGDWVLDPHNSSVRFTTKSMGLIPVQGVFREVSGSGTVSASGSAVGTLAVAAASIDTRNARRDTHLRSADFFDSDNHPDVTFTASSIQPSARGALTVTGMLTIRGRTRPLSFDATVSVAGDGEVWLDAEARVNRGDFDITWNFLGMVAQVSTVAVHAVFTRG